MKKIVHLGLACAAVVVLFFVFPGSSTPEEKIQKRLLQMERDFSRGNGRLCSKGLTDDFRDGTSGIGKADFRSILAQMVLTEKDKNTNQFLYRVVLPVEEMSIAVDPADPTRAHVDLVAVFEKLSGEEWRLFWKAAVSGDLIEGKDGWQIRQSTHVTLDGKPFR